MRKNNKAFTLVELLAVIVILAVIALIAVPVVLHMIEKSRIGAAENSVLSYAKAVENKSLTQILKGNDYEAGSYNVGEIPIDIKGTLPSNGTYILSKKGEVESGTFCINGYEIDYDGEHAIYNKKARYCEAGYAGSGILPTLTLASTPVELSKSKTITMKSNVDDVVIKYSIGDLTNEQITYSQPFEINENTTIYASLYQNDKKVASSSLTITSLYIYASDISYEDKTVQEVLNEMYSKMGES